MPPACFVKLVAACSGPCSGPQPEKRLGVTKDGIDTVDLVRSLDGEQQFFEDHRKLEHFRDDQAISNAVDALHQALEQPVPQHTMTMGGL